MNLGDTTNRVVKLFDDYINKHHGDETVTRDDMVEFLQSADSSETNEYRTVVEKAKPVEIQSISDDALSKIQQYLPFTAGGYSTGGGVEVSTQSLKIPSVGELTAPGFSFSLPKLSFLLPGVMNLGLIGQGIEQMLNLLDTDVDRKRKSDEKKRKKAQQKRNRDRLKQERKKIRDALNEQKKRLEKKFNKSRAALVNKHNTRTSKLTTQVKQLQAERTASTQDKSRLNKKINELERTQKQINKSNKAKLSQLESEYKKLNKVQTAEAKRLETELRKKIANQSQPRKPQSSSRPGGSGGSRPPPGSSASPRPAPPPPARPPGPSSGPKGLRQKINALLHADLAAKSSRAAGRFSAGAVTNLYKAATAIQTRGMSPEIKTAAQAVNRSKALKTASLLNRGGSVVAKVAGGASSILGPILIGAEVMAAVDRQKHLNSIQNYEGPGGYKELIENMQQNMSETLDSEIFGHDLGIAGNALGGLGYIAGMQWTSDIQMGANLPQIMRKANIEQDANMFKDFDIQARADDIESAKYRSSLPFFGKIFGLDEARSDKDIEMALNDPRIQKQLAAIEGGLAGNVYTPLNTMYSLKDRMQANMSFIRAMSAFTSQKYNQQGIASSTKWLSFLSADEKKAISAASDFEYDSLSSYIGTPFGGKGGSALSLQYAEKFSSKPGEAFISDGAGDNFGMFFDDNGDYSPWTHLAMLENALSIAESNPMPNLPEFGAMFSSVQDKFTQAGKAAEEPQFYHEKYAPLESRGKHSAMSDEAWEFWNKPENQGNLFLNYWLRHKTGLLQSTGSGLSNISESDIARWERDIGGPDFAGSLDPPRELLAGFIENLRWKAKHRDDDDNHIDMDGFFWNVPLYPSYVEALNSHLLSPGGFKRFITGTMFPNGEHTMDSDGDPYYSYERMNRQMRLYLRNYLVNGSANDDNWGMYGESTASFRNLLKKYPMPRHLGTGIFNQISEFDTGFGPTGRIAPLHFPISDLELGDRRGAKKATIDADMNNTKRKLAFQRDWKAWHAATSGGKNSPLHKVLTDLYGATDGIGRFNVRAQEQYIDLLKQAISGVRESLGVRGEFLKSLGVRQSPTYTDEFLAIDKDDQNGQFANFKMPSEDAWKNKLEKLKQAKALTVEASSSFTTGGSSIFQSSAQQAADKAQLDATIALKRHQQAGDLYGYNSNAPVVDINNIISQQGSIKDSLKLNDQFSMEYSIEAGSNASLDQIVDVQIALHELINDKSDMREIMTIIEIMNEKLKDDNIQINNNTIQIVTNEKPDINP